MNNKILIYLADLTYTGAVISSDIFPFAVGLIGAKLIDSMPDDVEIELFKFPDDFSAALETRPPKVVGFSNYSWNLNLAYGYAKKIKQRFPGTVVVFGGPNYGLTSEEISNFWRRYPIIDFYVTREGELAMVELLKQLISFDFDINSLKHSGVRLPNCHYLRDHEIVTEEVMPRIKSLDDIPSPYLMGLMDKFFDNNLIPLTHTTRGCPFKCTYCSEGSKYYLKVVQHLEIREELEYIAKRVKHTAALTISDANFGMFKEDIEKAKIIADIQRKYSYPKTVLVATGKNQKERVLEVISTLKGTMFISTALQSTNKTVLQNVERANISIEALTDVARDTKTAGANTYTELILALPGDTVEFHKKSLKDSVESGQGVVRMYQLIMLHQTELNTPDSIKKYEIKTKYRLMPRSYGRHKVYGEEFISIEAEKICVANSTMSFDDYLDCRELDLTIEILHNGGPFIEFWYLCDWLNYPWFDFLMSFHEQRKSHSAELKKLYETFRQENITGYWNSLEELEECVTNNFDEYMQKTGGTNEMSKAKAIAFFYLQEELQNILVKEMKSVLIKEERWDSTMELYLEQLKVFSLIRKTEVLNDSCQYRQEFNFDFLSLIRLTEGTDPRLYKVDKPVEYLFFLDKTQVEIFRSFSECYGKNTIDALGKILMRSRMGDLFRKVKPIEDLPNITTPNHPFTSKSWSRSRVLHNEK